ENATQPSQVIIELSSRILQIALGWLSEIEGLKDHSSTHNWQLINDTTEFKDALRNLIILSSNSNPTFIRTYLNRLIDLDEIPNEIFKHIIQLSGFIVQKHADLIVEFCLKKLLCELPL